MRRRVWVHLAVDYLVVPRPWRVGGTVLRPAHVLADSVRARHPDPLGGDVPAPHGASLSLANRGRRDIVGMFDDSAGERPTISVRAMLDPAGRLPDDEVERARGEARDALAVLRWLQHLRVLSDTSLQRFGLTGDLASAVEPRLVTDLRGELAGSAWTRHGVGGTWTFTAADVAVYRSDSRLRWLDRALATPDADRTDWQQRDLLALRMAAYANPAQRPQTRIILLATALEALVGDPFRPGRGATGAHGLARRAAYWWCAADITPPDPHGPEGRGRCPFLAREDPTGKPEAEGSVCSWYDDLRALSDDRNRALHGAEERFPPRAANRHEFTLDRVVEQALAWLVRTGSADFGDLDAEIASLRMEPRRTRRGS